MTASDPWNDPGPLIVQAAEAQRAGERERAYEMYARASELTPNTVEVWRGRAETTTSADDALVSWGYAFALSPNDQSIEQEFEQRLRARGEAAQPQDAATLVAMGQQLAEVGLSREAHLLLQRANELDGTLEEGYIWEAATADDIGEASIALKKAVALSPQDSRARAGYNKVIADLDAARWSSPSQARAATQGTLAAALSESIPELTRKGDQALAAGDKALAYQAFVRATELEPRDEGAWLGRARASSDIDETLTCLDQALAINPDNMQAREARTFYRVRKLREGVRKMEAPAEEPRFTPSFAGGGGFNEQATPQVRQRRIFLLVIMIAVLLFLIFVAMIQFGIIGR